MVKISGFCYKIVFYGLIRIEIDFIVILLQIAEELYESSCFNRFKGNGTQGCA